jgi:nucleotide-binding universal stress UspA family protein
MNSGETRHLLEAVDPHPCLQALLSSSPSPLRLRNVLVPVDFTDGSLRSLPYALFLVRQLGCTVTLLHVVKLNIVGEERGVPLARFLEEEKSAAERTLQQIALSLCLPARVIVKVGAPAPTILHEVAGLEIDLIIIARNPRKSIWQRLDPSVSRRIISESPCPTLVVS